MKIKICTIFFLLSLSPVFAQPLVPGFNKQEYISLIRISAAQAGMLHDEEEADSSTYSKNYQSPELGLLNQWELWTNHNGVAVISIRGTVRDYISWLENFYAAMVPAKGSLQLEKNYRFDYNLAGDSKAAVHTGWLIGTGMLVRDMLPKIDSLYHSGIKNLLIMGHSQGGAIAYLLTSHLYSLRNEGKIPSDIVIKTYCSAAPKPGNLYYAYAYEAMTEGWAFNVVNAADWVPEMPVSVQTTTDYNYINPFFHAADIINSQTLVKRIILKRALRKLSDPQRKSQEEYLHYLGDEIYTLVKRALPEYEKPVYFKSINYVRTGKTIVLLPDEAYYSVFPDDLQHLFRHHLFEPYLFLINRYETKLHP
jgi:hypothetical protein